MQKKNHLQKTILINYKLYKNLYMKPISYYRMIPRKISKFEPIFFS